TTQPDRTPAASQARGGAATELQAGGIAVVRAQGAFQPEGSGQATAEVFRTTEAQASAVVAGVGQHVDVLATNDRAGGRAAEGNRGLASLHRVVGVVDVDDTEQRDRRMGGSRTRGSQRSKRNQGLFHCK